MGWPRYAFGRVDAFSEIGGFTKLNSFGVFGFVKCLRFVGGIDVAAVDLMFYLCGISWIFIREGNLTRMAFT
jgi:hypothetical protein